MSALAVFGFLRRHGLTLEEVGTVGWEPRFKANPKSPAAQKCCRIARGWELMARLGLKFADLEEFVSRAGQSGAFRKRVAKSNT